MTDIVIFAGITFSDKSTSLCLHPFNYYTDIEENEDCNRTFLADLIAPHYLKRYKFASVSVSGLLEVLIYHQQHTVQVIQSCRDVHFLSNSDETIITGKKSIKAQLLNLEAVGKKLIESGEYNLDHDSLEIINISKYMHCSSEWFKKNHMKDLNNVISSLKTHSDSPVINAKAFVFISNIIFPDISLRYKNKEIQNLIIILDNLSYEIMERIKGCK